MFQNFFENKKVLVTGHTGFKGSWLVLWLHTMGAKTAGISLPPHFSPRLYEATSLPLCLEKEDFIDIRNKDSFRETLNDFQPEIIFHLAAQTIVRESYKSPQDTIETNILGTINLLESLRNCASAKSVIIVSSDKCYRNVEQVWGYREKDELGGKDPYSASKAAMEILLSSYKESYFSNNEVGIASVRAGNVIGGGDWNADRIIPDAMRALSSKKAILLRNPSAVRPWQHVLDALSGYLLLSKFLFENPHRYHGAWNFGPKDKKLYTVGSLAKALIQYWGEGTWQDLSNQQANNMFESSILRLNCDKAEHSLGWLGTLSFEEAIKFTVLWYKNYYQVQGKCSKNFSEQQIKDYYQLFTKQQKFMKE